MHRIAVCDDDKDLVQDVVSCIRDWCGEHGVSAEVGSYADGDALLCASAGQGFDLVFLDMVMPLVSGMDAARELRARDHGTRIIFLTSSPEFALESYEVKAADYLLKPVSHERIRTALGEWSQSLRSAPRSLVVKTATGYQRVYLDDIEYLEARGKKCALLMRGARNLESTEGFGDLAARLAAEPGFFRCHRSFLVNLGNIDHYGSAEIFTRSGRRIPVARNCRREFQDAYFSHRFEG